MSKPPVAKADSINVKYGPELVGAIDDLADARGIHRSNLLRQLAVEAVTAHRDGRPLFTQPTAPTDLASLGELAAQLAALNIELDRALRDHDRRVGKLERRWNAGEEATQAAYERLVLQLREQLQHCYQPFHDYVNGLQSALIGRLDALDASVAEHPRLAEISTRLTTLADAVKKARPHITYRFDDIAFAWWELLGLASVGFVFSAFSLLLAAKILPDSWLANPITVGMFGSTSNAICALYEQANGVSSCPSLTFNEIDSSRRHRK